MSGTISRRSAVGLLGAGGLAGALVDPMGSAAEGAPTDGGPLQAGSKFGRWTIDAVHPVQNGALCIDVHGDDGHRFTLEVMARDASPLAGRPPAFTEALAIYVCNGGDGWLPTAEEQGLAAMTLASTLSLHRQGGPIAGLLTHAERVVAYGEAIMKHTEPTLA